MSARKKYENDGQHIFFKSNKANGFAFLSNFWPFVSDPAKRACPEALVLAPSSFVVDGEKFLSVEHYFQAVKYVDMPAIFKDIKNQPTAVDAKKCNTKWKHTHPINVAHWEATKKGVMFRGLMGKFQQNPLLMEALLNTGNKELCEIPGRGSDSWAGERNTLGVIMMNVREELRKSPSSATSVTTHTTSSSTSKTATSPSKNVNTTKPTPTPTGSKTLSTVNAKPPKPASSTATTTVATTTSTSTSVTAPASSKPASQNKPSNTTPTKLLPRKTPPPPNSAIAKRAPPPKQPTLNPQSNPQTAVIPQHQDPKSST
ncbi:hypothetical protein Pelo_7932 [Pelomyxa schiedti]|nr:hypothetical protein Pelo_7932 [Pelomyxa schiedti]